MITPSQLAREYLQYAEFACVRTKCDRCGHWLHTDPECPRCDGRGYLEFSPEDFLEFEGAPSFDELDEIANGRPHDWAVDWSNEYNYTYGEQEWFES
jgi:hypothetical protein